MRDREYLLTDDYKRPIIRSYHSVLPPQKREYREHHHTECELSVFISGRGIYSVHGREYAFTPGDVFLLGSNEAHCITDIHEDMDLLNVHFEARLLWEHTENAELLNIFAARRREFGNRFTGDGLKVLIRNIEKELASSDDCRTVMARCLLFSTLVQMIRTSRCVDPQRVISPHSTLTRSLKSSMNYINDNLENRITLKEIADVACMTPTYFSAVFKKFNGVSPWEYITIKRVEKAIEMLRTTDMTKLEIAERCGFSSSSNFYKAFFSITGKRPGDFIIK